MVNETTTLRTRMPGERKLYCDVFYAKEVPTACIRESAFIVISDSRISTLFSEQKIQGLFKGFQGHISYFPRTPFSAKKSLESMSFKELPQHEQSYPEGLSVFAAFRHLRIWVG